MGFCGSNAHCRPVSSHADNETKDGTSSSSSLHSRRHRRITKVSCGHLYHTACLRQVIERARSLEAVKCPLCRAPIIDTNNKNNSTASAAAANPTNDVPQEAEVAERAGANNINNDALFRFSTKDLFPTWLPVPAFSFEVVRRPSSAG